MLNFALFLFFLGFSLSIFLGYCSWKLWKHGPYNANLRYQIYRTFLYIPTVLVLTTSFSLGVFPLTLFVWWKLIFLFLFIYISTQVTSGINNLFCSRYIEKKIDEDKRNEYYFKLNQERPRVVRFHKSRWVSSIKSLPFKLNKLNKPRKRATVE